MEMKDQITNIFRIIPLLFLCISLNACSDNEEPTISEQEEIITNQTIYKNDKEYCAFCDIVYYHGKYYIAFRCANNHVPYTENDGNGYIKIMSSWDGKIWQEELNIIDEKWDLRDPCFCLDTRDDVLSINYGLYHYNDKRPTIKNKRTVFSKNNDTLKIDHIDLIDIGDYSHRWIWKVYFNNNKYWGIAYSEDYPVLVCSNDGISYSVISEIEVNGNETALLFDNEELLAVSRHRDDINGKAFISISNNPYENWITYNTEYTIASPEMIKTDTGRIFVAGRVTSGKNEYGVSVFSYDAEHHTLMKYLNLFALGNYSDKGYPGMLYRDGRLYVVYYACNDYTAYPSIYMTSIKID